MELHDSSEQESAPEEKVIKLFPNKPLDGHYSGVGDTTPSCLETAIGKKTRAGFSL